MGATWTGLRVGQTASDYVRGLHDGLDVVAQGTAVGDSDYRWVHYAAVREDDGSVVAYVTPFTQEEGGVLYKTFTERSGPYFYTAPANVMAALTPTDNEWANEWRARVEVAA